MLSKVEPDNLRVSESDELVVKLELLGQMKEFPLKMKREPVVSVE